ncbi:MAG: glycosyltransferase family 4 protein [Gemmatimonadota bacterium]|nr:glycosyltransferase family 4 protein [Gemmatimonadota bacterium]
MRLLVVTHNYPRFAGDPAGVYVARLASAVAARGGDVRVVAPNAPGVIGGTDGVPVTRFRYAPRSLERVGYRGDVRWRRLLAPGMVLSSPLYLMAFQRAVARAVREFQPHVIHAHWWLPAGWVSVRTHVPVVVTCHGSDVRLLERSRVLRRLGARVLRQAAMVTTVSEFLSRDLRDLVGDPRPAVTVTPMPLDVDLFRRGATVVKADPPTILYAGNLVVTKGVDVLIDAFARLRRAGIGCRLRIVGEGPDADRLQALALGTGVGDAIEWWPFIPQTSMPEAYGQATITVLPSRGKAEGLGLSLVEAVLAGSAVVGTPAGGIPEVIEDGVTGLLTRDGDPEDLAAKLERLLGDPDLRRSLTDAGAARATEKHAADSVADHFLTLYDDAARNHDVR